MTEDRHTTVIVPTSQALLRSQLPVSPLTRLRRRPVDEHLLRVIRQALRPILRASKGATRIIRR